MDTVIGLAEATHYLITNETIPDDTIIDLGSNATLLKASRSILRNKLAGYTSVTNKERIKVMLKLLTIRINELRNER